MKLKQLENVLVDICHVKDFSSKQELFYGKVSDASETLKDNEVYMIKTKNCGHYSQFIVYLR